MTGEAIRIDNLTVRYGRKTAVDGVSVSVALRPRRAALYRSGKITPAGVRLGLPNVSRGTPATRIDTHCENDMNCPLAAWWPQACQLPGGRRSRYRWPG